MSWQDGRRSWLALGLLVAVTLGAAPDVCVAGKDKDAKVFAPPSAKVVAAWKEAGADFGWVRANQRGVLVFERREKGRTSEVPGFRFEAFTPGTIGRLPAPSVPFSLILNYTRVTDGDLKELAKLKQLYALGLGSTEVTDAGLKELAGLKQLRSLD